MEKKKYNKREQGYHLRLIERQKWADTRREHKLFGKPFAKKRTRKLAKQII